MTTRGKPSDRANMPLIYVVGAAAIAGVLMATVDHQNPLELPPCYSTALDRLAITITLEPDGKSIFPHLTVRSNRGQILLRGRVGDLIQGPKDQHIRRQK